MKKAIALMFLVTFLGGCASVGSMMFGANTSKLYAGMSESAVVDAIGWPSYRNTTNFEGSVMEQWVYPSSLGDTYVYLENRRVYSWQRING